MVLSKNYKHLVESKEIGNKIVQQPRCSNPGAATQVEFYKKKPDSFKLCLENLLTLKDEGGVESTLRSGDRLPFLKE